MTDKLEKHTNFKRATKSQKKKQREYILALYPLIEERKIGLITQEEFDARHRKIIKEL